MMKCFYHLDFDGKCAGAIVKSMNPDCEMFGIDYKDEFPFKDIEIDEEIIFVDFSLMPSKMLDLLDITKNVIWIDHHKSAIERYKDFPYEIEGIRKDGVSGCELTWRWFYPDNEIPEAVKLIGDRDIWKWEFGDRTKFFHAGLGAKDTNPESEVWFNLLISPKDYFVSDIIGNGKLLEKSKSIRSKELLSDIGFETEIEGHPTIACNMPRTGSEFFNSVSDNGYEIMAPFFFDGNQWTVSLYSTKIDVRVIAEKFGGGGHTGASGFQCSELPFKRK